MDEDFLLIRRMRKGEEEALEAFVRKYYPAILRYCSYRVLDAGDAEDIVQETFEKFFRSLPLYRHYGKACNYLYVIAGNLCRDFGRKAARAEVLGFSEERLLDEKENPIDEAISRFDLERALAELPEEQREVIALHYFQDLKLKEIAKILGIGLPRVKYRIKRAKERLMVLLEKEGQGWIV